MEEKKDIQKKSVKLDYPVFTLDDRLLLPAGKELTSEALDELISTHKSTFYTKLSFLEYGTIFQDIVFLIQNPIYCVIFDEPKRKIALNLMKNIHFIPPLIEFLDYFKKWDFYTYRHSLVVLTMSIIMAREILEKSEEWIMEAMAGTIHDFGKICVPLQILKKSDILTRTERLNLEHHVLAGFVLLTYYLQDPRNFSVRVAKEHHERRDKSGYPLGISLRDNMVEIVAVCDVYDALLSPRPYRPTPYANRTALEEITEMAQGGKFSWEVVQALVSLNRKDRPHFRECQVSTEKRGTPPADNLYGIVEDEDPVNRKGRDD